VPGQTTKRHTRAVVNRQTDQQTNHSVTTPVTCAKTRVSTRTKGQVRYDRLPTGEVVASIVRDTSASSSTKNPTRRVASGPESVGRRDRIAADSSCELPTGYPINQSNVTAVVEEAHRATQSMRILLCSMREELRRVGGLSSDGSSWTAAQLTQRRNITHRLAVAYQSYRKSIHDIENVQFRDGNPAGGGTSTRVSSSRSARPSSDAIVLSSSAADGVMTQRIPGAVSDNDQVIDLTK